MITIDQIEDKLITEIQAALTGEGTVETIVGDPETYIEEINPVVFPSVFIQYESNEPVDRIIYPGVITFGIYFVHEKSVTKTNQRILFDFMLDLWGRLNDSCLGMNIQQPLYLTNQGYYSYTQNFIIYKQTYQIGVG
jgi:hypothetical protein